MEKRTDGGEAAGRAKRETANRQQRRRFRTFTKRAVKVILFMALLDLQLSYLLAFLGREQIAENLSSDITKVIIGTILGYLAKSFFETREEEKVRLEEQAQGQEWGNEG